jgi:general secretion pathway protein A
MYTDFYNLTTLPFENTPDPQFFYACEQHREALAAIEYTIRMRKGFVMITGDIGSGKTTVGRTMIERCSNQAHIVHILHGHTTGDELLRQLIRQLELPVTELDDHASMLESLSRYFQQQSELDHPIVLLVDEAQTLSNEALEELRLLSNFDTATSKLVQVVLIGQPELRERVRSSQLSALRQRLVMAKQLRPMSIEQVDQYITHRLTVASIDPDNVAIEFSEAAVANIYKFSSGVPRLINFVCDNCLLLGYVREILEPISKQMVSQVINDMLPSLERPARPEPRIVTRRKVADRLKPVHVA